jgi:Uncharacterized protein conserved in bacteria (DUF2325)
MCSTDRKMAVVPNGSRRRRLWELPHACHCSIIGICIPLSLLRRLVNKLAPSPLTDDYEIHSSAVSQCQKRGLISEALQSQIEKTHRTSVVRFRAAKSQADLLELWNQTVVKGDLAGAFWAALTHPRCDTNLQDVLYRHMHMLEHQSFAGEQSDQFRIHALTHENGVLVRELGRVQARCTALLLAKDQALQQLEKQMTAARLDGVIKDEKLRVLCSQRSDLTAVRTSSTQFDAKDQMIVKLKIRVKELEVIRSISVEPKLTDPISKADRELSPNLTLELQSEKKLENQAILCVGGRHRSVARYRDLVERTGAYFAHHDGGKEDNLSSLEAKLSAADAVICQTGCVSHNAYWQVKDYCKRHDKRCIFVANPSANSLKRELQQLVRLPNQA